MPTATAALTSNDQVELELPDGVKQYELSDGELIPVGTAFALHEFIKTAIFEILTEYRLRTRSGRAFADSMFTLRSDRARIPDIAWVSNERLAQILPENRAIPIARQGNRGTRLTGDDIITSERLPDFSVSVSEFFRF